MMAKKMGVHKGKIAPLRTVSGAKNAYFKVTFAPRKSAIVTIDSLPDEERRVQVAAARLRVTLDERLNRHTPPEVKALAKEAL